MQPPESGSQQRAIEGKPDRVGIAPAGFAGGQGAQQRMDEPEYQYDIDQVNNQVGQFEKVRVKSGKIMVERERQHTERATQWSRAARPECRIERFNLQGFNRDFFVFSDVRGVIEDVVAR